MSDEPKITHGYKQVAGHLQKGDGLWDGRRFRKVCKEFPFLGERVGVAIRRCEVVQPELIPASKLEAEKPLCLDE